MQKSQKGITLIELAITVTIISILAVIAVPSYQQHMRRSHRSDAMSALLRIAADQEKFYMQNSRYANMAELGSPATEHGFYSLFVMGNNATTYTAFAMANNTGPQFADQKCRLFLVNAIGIKLALSSGFTPQDDCWR